MRASKTVVQRFKGISKESNVLGLWCLTAFALYTLSKIVSRICLFLPGLWGSFELPFVLFLFFPKSLIVSINLFMLLSWPYYLDSYFLPLVFMHGKKDRGLPILDCIALQQTWVLYAIYYHYWRSVTSYIIHVHVTFVNSEPTKDIKKHNNKKMLDIYFCLYILIYISTWY